MLQNATPLRKSAPSPPNISDEHVSCIAFAKENVSLQILFKCPTPAIAFGNATKYKTSRFARFWQGGESLRLPHKTTLQRPKVARTCGALYILTSTCASQHNGVHFLNISTSKSVMDVVCFARFDFQMCFAPQRRPLFRHLNLEGVLRATTACNFSSLI